MSEMLNRSPGGRLWDKNQGNKGRKRIVIVLLALLLLLLVLLLRFFGVFLFPWEKNTVPVVAGDPFPAVGDAEQGHLSGMTEAELMEQMQRIADASQFSFKINARPVFKDGDSEGNLRIENPGYNIYPMVVQITLDDTGEVIYDSGGILPDQHINNAKLSKSLSKGAYAATADLYAYDPDTLEYQGQSAVKLTITIEN